MISIVRQMRLKPDINRHFGIIPSIARRASVGVPGGNRTCDLQIRNLSLYPTELRALNNFRKYLLEALLAQNLAVPTIARRASVGAPGRVRTCNLRIRSPALYPIELQAHILTHYYIILLSCN